LFEDVSTVDTSEEDGSCKESDVIESPNFYITSVRNKGVATTQQTLTEIEPDLVSQYVSEDGSTIETRENDDGTVEEQCPSCGGWYEKISAHWGHPSVSCEHPPISKRKWEMFKGLLMGDASVGKRNHKNSDIVVTNTNLTFLEYLEDEVGWISTVLYQFKTAQESANNLNGREMNGIECSTESDDCVDSYMLNTRRHPIFNHFEQWWETGEKAFPEIEYTKPLLRMWWISDGSFDWRPSGKARVRFTSKNESRRPENITQSFSDIGFDCSVYGVHFTLPVTQTEDFFDYIGHDPVPGFEYKWAYEDRDRYERLMEEGKEKHHTQTIE